jgi:hypothetical protein
MTRTGERHGEVPDEVHLATLEGRRHERTTTSLDRALPLLDRAAVEGLLDEGSEARVVGLVALDHEGGERVPQEIEPRVAGPFSRERDTIRGQALEGPRDVIVARQHPCLECVVPVHGIGLPKSPIDRVRILVHLRAEQRG